MINWFYLFFFLSGFTALIYETAFAHQLHLIFGSTLSAVTIVLAVYLGGMAMGAALLGPRADKYNPLRLYGFIEIGIGLTAFLAVLLIPFIRNIYATFATTFGASSHSIFLQCVLAILFLIPSTLLMGATLPALTKGLTSSLKQRFTRISRLYGINTLGAASGTLLCGFLLLEHLGYLGTVIAAMAVNIAIGAVALRLSKRTASFKPSEAQQSRDESPVPVKTALPGGITLRKLVLILALVSGIAALGYEIVWFRILTFSVVTDAYAFAQMLGIYLFGIGAGSLTAAWRFRRKEGTDWEKTTAWFELGILEILVSVLVVAGFAVLIMLNEQLQRPAVSDPSFWLITLRNTGLQALVLILPVTFILGYIFPMLISLYSANMKKLGGQVGWVTALNTTGSIIGIFASGFILIPLIGIQYTLFLFAILSALVGLTALIFGQMKRNLKIGALAAGAPICLLALLFFPMRDNFGFLQIPTHANAKLLYYRECADHTVMVTQDRGGREIRRLLINQQQATSTGLAGQRKNQLLGHLPLWACPDAKNAMVICFGSGGTFGALGLYDLEQVDCIEICPTVLQAAPFFNEWNGEVLSKPHVRVIIDDGRSYLLTAKEKYDVITLEPMHPGLKGVSSLYSREFYQEAYERLDTGGVLCQWIPLYSMTDEDARSLIATAVDVFPQSSLWIIGLEGILLSAKDELVIDMDWLETGFADVDIQNALSRVLLDNPWSILSGYYLGPDGLKDYTAGAPIMSDNRPFTEYSIPRHKHLNPWSDILMLAEKRESPIAIMKGLDKAERIEFEQKWKQNRAIWIERDRGFAAYEQGDLRNARPHLEKACAGDPDDRYAAFFLKELYWRYGVEFTRRGLHSEAVEAYRKALALDTDDAEAHFYLALALENAGDKTASISAAQTALALKSDYPEVSRFLAKFK